MSVTWRGAEPAPLPAPGPSGWLRLGLRAPAAAVWTAGMFALFLLLRGIDRRAPRGARARAPWAVQAWARGTLALLGLRVRQAGAPMDHPGALVANHSSWLDVVALQRAAHASFVAKAEVAGWPVIGAIGRAIGASFVERRRPQARRQSEALRARLGRGDRLCVFPEGTSTDGLRVLPFKSTLFAAFFAPDPGERLRVQPVSLAYRAPEGLPATFYAWWGDMGFGRHLRDVLAHSRGGEVWVLFHPPLRASDFPDRKALAEAARAAVRAGLAGLEAHAPEGGGGPDLGPAPPPADRAAGGVSGRSFEADTPGGETAPSCPWPDGAPVKEMEMTTAIRPARQGDAAAIVRMVRAERLNPTGLDWRNFQVAEEDGAIVGVVQIRPKGPELGSLAVRPDRRGRGLAGRLIAAALERAARPVFVICPASLAPFYRRHGFEPRSGLSAPGAVRLHYAIGHASVLLALLRRRRPRRLVVLELPRRTP